jgi:hypothetical protein
MVNIRTRNTSGHLALKSMMAGSVFHYFPNAAIVASRCSGARHQSRRALLISNGNLHTNVLVLKKYFLTLYFGRLPETTESFMRLAERRPFA